MKFKEGQKVIYDGKVWEVLGRDSDDELCIKMEKSGIMDFIPDWKEHLVKPFILEKRKAVL